MKTCPVCGLTLTTTEMLDHQRQAKHLSQQGEQKAS
jgi:hypothetical protein